MRKEPVVTKYTRFVGLDVHRETIAVAVADGPRAPESVGVIPNTPDAVARLVRRLRRGGGRLSVGYEAGPCGYGLYRQLTALGIDCVVVAPTLVPVRPGDRVKTDVRDALKLARLLRSGDLTPVWVPDAAHEALRDVVRAREAARADLRSARQRLSQLLLRQGQSAPRGCTPWGRTYLRWIRQLTFGHAAQEAVRQDLLAEVDHHAERITRLEQAITIAANAAPPALRAVMGALQTLRGVAALTAVTMIAELGDVTRFARARQLMAYTGVVPREHSSGDHRRRGGITRTGNAHVRRVLIEAAWHYRHPPAVTRSLRRRRVGQAPAVCAVADKAQRRLHDRYLRLLRRGKTKQKIVVALGRELLGFVWAIARTAPTAQAA
jgi:transposase